MSSPDAIDVHALLSRPHVRGEHHNPLARRHWNRYAGPCGNCGGHIPEGWGTLEEVNGKWRIVHLWGECEPVGEAPIS
jgi:hypothetical protein